jgi:CheY-like chemotaxis protein
MTMGDGQEDAALLVEDNEDSRVLVAALLTRGGHHILEPPTTGGNGIRMATEKQPDLIVLYIQAPDRGGLAALRRPCAILGKAG